MSGNYVVEEHDRRWFAKGTKGWRGVCSAPLCVNNARWSFLTPAHYHYGLGVIRLARCDVHTLLPRPLKCPRTFDYRERTAMGVRRLHDEIRGRHNDFGDD